jgi:hypothetical protein
MLCLLVTNAWKNAIVILTLRYLFFDSSQKVSSPIHVQIQTLQLTQQPPPSAQSPQSSSTDSEFYTSRYALHNTAFNNLVSNLSLFPTGALACNIRFILIPIIILSLVTTPSSPERALCLFLFREFKGHFASPSPGEGYQATSPDSVSSSSQKSSTGDQGLGTGNQMIPESETGAEMGTGLDVEIPWERLDKFSAEAAKLGKGKGELTCGTVEWNWWDMLREVELDLACMSPPPFSSSRLL